jgi:hypothetical protein
MKSSDKTKLEGLITVERRNRVLMMIGFTQNDFKFLKKAARNIYNIKSKKTRILKKYVKMLLNDALRRAVEVKNETK